MSDLIVNLKGNQSGFQQMLNSARNEAKALSHEWSAASLGKRAIQGGMAYLGFEAIKSSFEAFIQKASGIREVAEQLDMSAEATQRWQKAADKLGLSFGTVQNVLMAIGQKRIDALTDPKVAEQFTRLGIPRQAVLKTQELDSSKFAEMVFESAKGEGRDVFGEMFGLRALKTAGVGEKFKGAKAYFSDDVIEAAHEAEVAEKKVGAAWGRIWGGAAQVLVHIAEVLSSSPQKVQRTAADDAALARHFGFEPPEPPKTDIQRTAEALNKNPVVDPLESLNADKALQREQAVDAAQRGQRDRERQVMTIGQRRVSIMQEMLRIRRQIEQEEMRTAPLTLKTEEDKADWEAKRQERLANLRGMLVGYQGELRDHPLFTGAADNLSKAGLFTSPAAISNPATDQLNTLKRIEHHTFKMANRSDPATP